MKLKELTLRDKALFRKFLTLSRHELAVYAFENIYIWKALFEIRWEIIDESLCIFFQDKAGCFLYLPPLGKIISPGVIGGVFRIMDSFNLNKNVSRIENIEKRDLAFYERLGLKLVYKSCDYLSRRRELAQLEGNRFKSKRASFNYFIKHYSFEYLPFTVKYRRDCRQLYELWMQQRAGMASDVVYQGMLKDSRACLELLLRDYQRLGVTGRIVKVGNRLEAFTFGFPLNPETFCILYETADLKIRGLAQFIFRHFCAELKDYRYINVMDDSGLENLKRVKLSYRPLRLIPSYIAVRDNA